MSRRRCIVAVFVTTVLAGCGGGGSQAPLPAPPETTSATRGGEQVLRSAVLGAVRDNHRLSVRVLLTNRVPVPAPSTAGPALAALRTAAAERESRGLRVRTLRSRYRVLSVRLDPSYSEASATVVDRQTVQLETADGVPVGSQRELVERAVVELRRIPGANRFVVRNLEVLP